LETRFWVQTKNDNSIHNQNMKRYTDLVAGVGVAERVAEAIVVPGVDEDSVLSFAPVSSISRRLFTTSQCVVPRLYGETKPCCPPSHAADKLLFQMLQVLLATHAAGRQVESLSNHLITSDVNNR